MIQIIYIWTIRCLIAKKLADEFFCFMAHCVIYGFYYQYGVAFKTTLHLSSHTVKSYFTEIHAWKRLVFVKIQAETQGKWTIRHTGIQIGHDPSHQTELKLGEWSPYNIWIHLPTDANNHCIPVLSITAHKISTLVLFPFPRSFLSICYFSHKWKRFSLKLACNLVAPHPVLPQNIISCSFTSPAHCPVDFFLLPPLSQN